jgi:signal transduction histidine kinase
MRTRAEALGGTLTAGPDLDAGFVVSASLPISKPVPTPIPDEA